MTASIRPIWKEGDVFDYADDDTPPGHEMRMRIDSFRDTEVVAISLRTGHEYRLDPAHLYNGVMRKVEPTS